MPFATIGLKENNLGTISNADGDFKIPCNPRFQSDSLIITFIGFKRYSIPFRNLIINKVNEIYLAPVVLELSGVEVLAKGKKLNSLTIIRRAIRNIRKNCPTEPFNYVSYYRDYQKKDNSYINLNEAIVQTLDSGYKTPSASNNFRLLDFRQNMDFQRLNISQHYDTLSQVDMDDPNKFIRSAYLPDQGGNELFILMIHDPIRNSQTETFSFINTLSQDFITNHVFSEVTSVFDNNLSLYKINFTAKHRLTGDSLLVSGDIYIQPEDYSIHKIEYSGSYLLMNNEKKKMFEVVIEYGRENSVDSLMGLKYISFNNIFNVVDVADSTYFKVLKSYIKPGNLSNSTFIVEFNHVPDLESARNKENYEIVFESKKAKILQVSVRENKAIINIRPETAVTTKVPHFEIAVRNIKDINGRLLNRKKDLEFYQYRELFVQEYNKPLSISESCFLQNVPLIQNCISKYNGDQKYWMNTPINTDTSEVTQGVYFGDPDLISSGSEMTSESVTEKWPEVNINNTLLTETAVSPISQYLLYQQKSMGSDQVFVQLDRNICKPGDTIYFEAYIRDRFTGVFETQSLSMYALLFNENHIKIDSSRFKIRNSVVSGWMAIPQKAEAGNYHFVAFTSMMQNFDPADAFQLDIYVKKQSINPDKISVAYVKEKYYPGDTLEATIKITDPIGSTVNEQKFTCSFITETYSVESGETQTNSYGESLIKFKIPDTIRSQPQLRVTTTQNADKESLIKDFYIPFEDPYFELRFLPEAGTFIEGLEQRVGFNATNFKGEPVSITGLLKNSSGSILDTIKSGTFGPGYFTCIAQRGLNVELIKSLGSQKIWPLPDPEVNGISLHLWPIDNRSFAVEVQSNNYNGDTVTVSGVMNTSQVFLQQLVLNKKQRFMVNTDQLSVGIINITLFNKDLKPLAERLFYANRDNRLKFNIESQKVYEPGQETELAISITDGQENPIEGFFSIAVTDSVTGINSQLFSPGIEYTYNYQPYFPGNLPPKVLSKGLENMTDEECDLLLMVYGWSRINWAYIQEKPEVKQIADYDLLKMKILYASPDHLANRNLDLLSLEGPSYMHLTTNDAGEISLPLDSLPEITRSVTLIPDSKNKNSAAGAMLSIPFNEQYFRSNKLFIPQPTIPSDEYKISMPDEYIPMDKKMIELPKFTVLGHHQNKKIYHDEYEERFQYSRVNSLDLEILHRAFDLRSAMSQMHLGTDPYLFVLDGLPLYDQSVEALSNINPGDITSFTVLNGKKGMIFYGGPAKNGVIFINTAAQNPRFPKFKTKWIPQNKMDKMLVPIELYRPTIEFYNPTRLESDTNLIFQNRATILWQPEVYFDGKEPVRIKYSNLKHNGPVIITINGVSTNNLIGSGRASYMVQ